MLEDWKTPMEHESDGDSNCNWRARYSPQFIITGTGRLENKTCGDHPNCSITKIGQNTEKSPGDLRRFTVIQTPETEYQHDAREKKII